MATIAGTGGNVTIAGYNAKMSAWSATLEIADAETTGFDDAGFRTFAPCIVSMRGSATGTCIYDVATSIPAPPVSTGTMTLPGAVAVVLTASSGNTYSFNAVVSNVSFDRPSDGKMGVTFDFESSGAVTCAWS